MWAHVDQMGSKTAGPDHGSHIYQIRYHSSFISSPPLDKASSTCTTNQPFVYIDSIFQKPKMSSTAGDAKHDLSHDLNAHAQISPSDSTALAPALVPPLPSSPSAVDTAKNNNDVHSDNVDTTNPAPTTPQQSKPSSSISLSSVAAAAAAATEAAAAAASLERGSCDDADADINSGGKDLPADVGITGGSSAEKTDVTKTAPPETAAAIVNTPPSGSNATSTDDEQKHDESRSATTDSRDPQAQKRENPAVSDNAGNNDLKCEANDRTDTDNPPQPTVVAAPVAARSSEDLPSRMAVSKVSDIGDGDDDNAAESDENESTNTFTFSNHVNPANPESDGVLMEVDDPPAATTVSIPAASPADSTHPETTTMRTPTLKPTTPAPPIRPSPSSLLPLSSINTANTSTATTTTTTTTITSTANNINNNQDNNNSLPSASITDPVALIIQPSPSPSPSPTPSPPLPNATAYQDMNPDASAHAPISKCANADNSDKDGSAGALLPSSFSGRRKRTRLTVKQKMEVLRRLDKGERQSVLAAEYGCSKRALARLKQERAKFTNLELTEADGNRKSRHSVKHIILETKLAQFLKLARLNSFPITGNAIRRAALKLRDDLRNDSNLPKSELSGLMAFQASINWSKGFLRRCAIRTVDHTKVESPPPMNNGMNNNDDKVKTDPSVSDQQQQQDGDGVGRNNGVDNARVKEMIMGLHKKLMQFDIDCIFAVEKIFMFYKLLPNELVMKPANISNSVNTSTVSAKAKPSTPSQTPIATKIAPRPVPNSNGQAMGSGIVVGDEMMRAAATAGQMNNGLLPLSTAPTLAAPSVVDQPSVTVYNNNTSSSALLPTLHPGVQQPPIAERVTLLLATNVTGSVKVTPTMVGNESMADCQRLFPKSGECKLPYFRDRYAWVDDTILKTWFYDTFIPAIRRHTDKPVAVLVNSDWTPVTEVSDPKGQVHIIPIAKEIPLDCIHPMHVGILSVFRRSLRYALLNSLISRGSVATDVETNSEEGINKNPVKHEDDPMELDTNSAGLEQGSDKEGGVIDSRLFAKQLNVCAFSHLVELTWNSLTDYLIHKCWFKSGILPTTLVSYLKQLCAHELEHDHDHEYERDVMMTSSLMSSAIGAGKPNPVSDEQLFYMCCRPDQTKLVQTLDDLILNRRLTTRGDVAESNGAELHHQYGTCSLDPQAVARKRAKDLVTSLHEGGRRAIQTWLDVEQCQRSQRALTLELDRIIAEYESPIVLRKGGAVPGAGDSGDNTDPSPVNTNSVNGWGLSMKRTASQAFGTSTGGSTPAPASVVATAAAPMAMNMPYGQQTATTSNAQEEQQQLQQQQQHDSHQQNQQDQLLHLQHLQQRQQHHQSNLAQKQDKQDKQSAKQATDKANGVHDQYEQRPLDPLPDLDEVMKLLDPVQKVVHQCESGAAPCILRRLIHELIRVKREQENQVENGI